MERGRARRATNATSGPTFSAPSVRNAALRQPLVVPAANTEVMSLHLAEIGRQVAPGSHAALVLDGAGYHVAKDLAVPHNITLVPLPPYAPELNPIENVWEYLRGNKLAITVFDSYDDILDKACDAWTFFANDQNRIASITTRSWATVIL